MKALISLHAAKIAELKKKLKKKEKKISSCCVASDVKRRGSPRHFF